MGWDGEEEEEDLSQSSRDWRGQPGPPLSSFTAPLIPVHASAVAKRINDALVGDVGGGLRDEREQNISLVGGVGYVDVGSQREKGLSHGSCHP